MKGYRHWVIFASVFLLQIAFFGFVALHRFIDGDEGSYLLASRLVLSHKTPYLDFFYNQAPLLPYAYAAWLKIAGISWHAGRMFSVVLSALLGMVLCEQAYHQTRRWFAAISAVILFASSALVFAWYPIVKTHTLAALFLFGAYVVVSRSSGVTAPRLLAIGGVLFGLSVDSRSYLLLLAPVFIWWIASDPDKASRARCLLFFGGGFVAGTLPSFCLFIASPDIFLFDNLRYHSIRSNAGLIGWWQEKLVLVVQLFLGSGESNGLQWSMLFFVSAGLLSSLSKRCAGRLAFWIASSLAIICLLPTPTYLQYFSVCVPFLIVSAVVVSCDFYAALKSRGQKLALIVVSAFLLSGYVSISKTDLHNYLVTGDGVPGLRLAADRNDWKIERVVEVSESVSSYATRDDIVASFWPGDIFQTTARPLPGLENPFALPIADKLSAEQRMRYHILSSDEILATLAFHKPRVVVLRSQILAAVTAEEFQKMQALVSTFRTSLAADGYVSVRSIGGISVYVYGLKGN